MRQTIRLNLWLALLMTAGACALASPGAAIIPFQPFGTNGEGGQVNGQLLTFGTGGAIEELDAFVGIAGMDLNGGTSGTTAQLSVDALPAALDFGFSFSLSDDKTDLTLTYTFENTGASILEDIVFLSFVDAEIDESVNTFFNEAASSAGTLAPGQNFEVDEPGFVFGNIFTHLRSGVLDGINAIPAGSPEDVSMALSFALGDLGVGATRSVEILLSEDGSSLGGFALTQFDADPSSLSELTYSGRVVPEPGTLLLLGFGLGGLAVAGQPRRRSGS